MPGMTAMSTVCGQDARLTGVGGAVTRRKCVPKPPPWNTSGRSLVAVQIPDVFHLAASLRAGPRVTVL